MPPFLPDDPAILRALLETTSKEELYRTARGLLDRGEDIDATDGNGNTALWHACNAEAESAVRLFVSLGANVNFANKDGYTPLDRVPKRNERLCEFLRSHGARTSTES